MPVAITASYDGKTYSAPADISRAVERALLTDTSDFMKDIAVELKNALDKLFKDLATRHGTAWPEGTTSATLSVRSGAGLRSIKDSIAVTATANEVTGSISPAKLTVHEHGATVTAKRAQYLTIPLRAAMDSRGVPLRSKARDWDNTFIARTKRGNLIIFQRQTGGRIIPLYLLRKSVKIPARLGMADMFEQMLPYFERRMIEALERKVAQ